MDLELEIQFLVVKTIHGSQFGDTFYGTDDYEKFFANGGDNILNMGVGEDKVLYLLEEENQQIIQLL